MNECMHEFEAAHEAPSYSSTTTRFNHPQMAEEPTEEPRIVFALQAPFRIRSINEAWLVEYGVTLGDCRVRSCVCASVGLDGEM